MTGRHQGPPASGLQIMQHHQCQKLLSNSPIPVHYQDQEQQTSHQALQHDKDYPPCVAGPHSSVISECHMMISAQSSYIQTSFITKQFSYPWTKTVKALESHTFTSDGNVQQTVLQRFAQQYKNALQKVQGDTKKWELLKNPTKIEEIEEKKFIDRN